MAAEAWKRVSFAEAQHAAPPEIDFCLSNFLAGSVGVVAAQAGIGKTSILMQIAASVALGVPLAGGLLAAPRDTGRVVFLATEDPWSVLTRRAHFLTRYLAARHPGRDIGRELDARLSFHALHAQVPTLLIKGAIGEKGLDRLQSLARDSRLLILDPIRRFHLCDEQDYGQMAQLFGVLSDIAGSTGCSILFSHHLPQATASSGLDDPEGAMGSSAFINATRWVMNLTAMSRGEAERHAIGLPDRRNYVRASFTKSNYGAPLPACWLHRSEEFEGVFERCELPMHPDGSEG